MNALDFSREATRTLLSRLEEMGTVETLTDDEPRSIELSLSADQGDRIYGILRSLNLNRAPIHGLVDCIAVNALR
jgi:hypothetical protein